jgi:hypothetical protein
VTLEFDGGRGALFRGPPAAVIQALATPRQQARETRRAGRAAVWDESMEYWDCTVQRAAFLPD